MASAAYQKISSSRKLPVCSKCCENIKFLIVKKILMLTIYIEIGKIIPSCVVGFYCMDENSGSVVLSGTVVFQEIKRGDQNG